MVDQLIYLNKLRLLKNSLKLLFSNLTEMQMNKKKSKLSPNS